MKITLAIVLSITVLALILVVLLRDSAPTVQPRSDRTNREVALTCTTDMATKFHIHPILEIVVDGKTQVIPANIGIGATCMNALHTHDTTGTIHVESPEKRDFTLTDFFAVWDKPFNREEVLGYTADTSHRIRVTVNGVAVDTFENTILKDKEKLVIIYESI